MSRPGSREVIDFLQASPVFAGLPARELESLAATAREESCRAREYIFHEGDPALWLCLVKTGHVRIVRHSRVGKDVVLELLGPGEIFGGVAVIERRPYPAAAQATEPSVVVKIPADVVVGLAERHPPLVREMALLIGRRLSERLARWQLLALAAGIMGMVGHFWIGRWDGLTWAAALVGAGILSHVINVALSVRGLARWSFTARGVALALGGLALTAAFGVTLALTHGARVFPGGLLGSVHAHFHLALLGWIAPMIMAVGARVYPMFLLAPEPVGGGASIQLGGLGLGVPALAAGLMLGRPALVVAGAVAVAVALGVHVGWVAGFARRRKRPTLDWGLCFVLTGTACLVPAGGLGLALAFGLGSGPRAALAYAVLALGGWVSLTIVGMMLKIVPFLVWYRVYAPRAGRERVPTLAQLSWPGAERLAYGLLTAGILALTATVAAGEPAAIAVTGAIVGVGALVFAAALGRTLLHLRPCAAGRHAPALPARP